MNYQKKNQKKEKNLNSKKIKFIGTLPPIQSAFKIYGLGDGARIQIDIPKSDLPSVLHLLKLTGKRIIFEVYEDVNNDDISKII